MNAHKENCRRRQVLVRALADVVVELAAVGDFAAAQHAARLLQDALEPPFGTGGNVGSSSTAHGEKTGIAPVVDLALRRARRGR